MAKNSLQRYFDNKFSNLFVDDFNETFRVLMNDLFSDRQKIQDVFKNQVSYPKCDVYETNDNIVFNIAVPGLRREDIDITFENNTLAVGYTKKTENENNEFSCLLKELRSSSWTRAWSINSEINDQDISANLADGILVINIPKKVKLQNKPDPKKISIS